MTLNLILLAVAVALFTCAWRVLASDARAGYDVSMGGAMYFSAIWLIASVMAAVAGVKLLGIAWWWGILLFAGSMLIKSVFYRIIVAWNLGADAPPLPKNGFKEFIRKTEDVQKSGHSPSEQEKT
jgi:hypothetical protein